MDQPTSPNQAEQNHNQADPVVEAAAAKSDAPLNPPAEEIPEPPPSISWEASEFIQHDKPAWWYLALTGAALALTAVFVLLHQYPTIALVVVMALAVWVYSRKEPRTLQYELDEKGVTIAGKSVPYSHYRSYSTHSEVGWQELELEPAKRFSQRLTLLVNQDNFDAINRVLAHHLPKVERERDAIERITRYIKF